MNIVWDIKDVVQLLLLIIKIFIQLQVRTVFSKDKLDVFVGLNTRDGTNLDASRLEGTFLGLGFDTEVYHNRTALQILTIVEQGEEIFC
jgi:hypothetical protein